MGLREQKKQQTRQAILTAAEQLLLEQGYKDCKIADICQVVGISSKTLFNYFNSKAQILEQIVLDKIEHILQQQIDLETQVCMLDALVNNMRLRMRAIEPYKPLLFMVLEHTDLFDFLPQQIQGSSGLLGQNRDELLGRFQLAKMNGEIRTEVSAEQALDHFLALRNNAIIKWIFAEQEAATLEQEAYQAVTIYLQGLGEPCET